MRFFGSGKKKPVTVSVFGKTDVGRTREHNEDTFLVADLTSRNVSLKPEVREHELGPRGSLFVVADGMGGAAAGEIASDLAAKAISSHMLENWVDDDEVTPERFAYRLREAVEEANGKIHQYSKDHPELKGMGTTATAVGVMEDHLYLTQIGDSRAYLIRKGSATQLTKDQSLMQKLIDAGELTEEEAERSERKNIILQALGPEPVVKVDLTHQELRNGDMLVLCSDGLSGQVSKDEIAEAAVNNDLVQACSDLIDLANERGGPDNITVIIARFSGDGLAEPESDEAVGHQVYPLLDTESTTEPVPVYRGSDPPAPGGTSARNIGVVVAGTVLMLVLALALAAG